MPKQLLELSIVGSCAGTRDRRRETGNVRQKTCSETVMGEFFFKYGSVAQFFYGANLVF